MIWFKGSLTRAEQAQEAAPVELPVEDYEEPERESVAVTELEEAAHR